MRRHPRVLVLLAVALAVIAAGLVMADRHTLRRAEHLTVDARYALRGADRGRAPGLVVVAVDEATFGDLRDEGKRASWPFPRRYHAQVIDALRRAGAKVIAFDVQFTEPTRPADDNALIEAIGRAGNVVLSTTTVGPGGTTNVLGGDKLLRELGARAGNASVVPDSDGTIRTTQYEIGGLETFGVVTAEVATGRPVRASRFGGPRRRVPIDYAGPPGTIRTISYSRVLDGRFPRDAVAGNTVIVGATAPSLQDLHETPGSGGAPMAGPELLANTTATVLRDIPLKASPGWVTTVLVAAFALAIWVAGVRLGTLAVALTGLGLLAAWLVASQIAFGAGALVDVTDPAAALLLATGATVMVGWWTDARERKRLRRLFAAASPTVVEDVLRPSGARALEPTAIIAGYRIESVVGRGGMGVVYRATQQALERVVALKLIATERAQDPLYRARFERESRLAASIEHVNVIPVYEAGEDDGLLFIAMRLVEGVDLAQVLQREGRLDPARAGRIVGRLAAALDAAHARGLVHRDVKPANVLLTLDDPEHVYLTDFGVAKELGAAGALTRTGGLVGTLDYLAPESIRGEPAGPAGDVYALAALLSECLTGQIPFPRDSEAAKLWAHVNAAPPAPSRQRPDLPGAVDEVIARGMAKDPAERYESATALARAYERALTSTELLA
jgi:CHASE2 domain-containing sensor protein/predicted Ser/Thr protein kinase